MTEALIFSLPAARRFQSGVIPPEKWSHPFKFDEQEDKLITINRDSVTFVFRLGESAITPSIVVQLDNNKLFSCFADETARLDALKRIVDAGLLIIDGNGELPSYWRPFTRGKFLSFQALSIASGDARRVVLWRRLPPAPNPCVFIFDVTEKQSDYDALNPNLEFLELVLEGRSAALATLPVQNNAARVGPTALTLDELRPSEQVDAVVQGWKLGYLYQNRLTRQQRDFVDAELDRPIRLKGAAGTGKTLAMVAKLLRESKIRRQKDEPYRFLFLTHNASAAELASQYANGLDEDELMSQANPQQLIHIDTLLGLAIQDLSDDLGDLRPVSNDAHEGKQLQLIILSDVIAAYQRGAWITRRSAASENIRRSLDSAVGTPSHEEFVWDVMNEVATVLDAEGVRDATPKREAYLKERRQLRSIMSLELVADRQIILDIYDLYREQLKKQNLISVDQLTADYVGFLDSFRWDARRHRLGYDAVFVDEFHLFNSLERITFGSLLRGSESSVPIILMALDPRQSPRAVFLSIFGMNGPVTALKTGRSTAPLEKGQAQNLRDFEFSDVFRYTPQIADLLAFINLAFPETDLAEEWLPGAAKSVLPSGELPTAHEAVDRLALYDYAMSEAQSSIKRVGRGKIAMLTLSQKAFEQIKIAGKYKNKIYVVDSRDSLNRLQYTGGRIVFSMPEYVAGVQFDYVIVADVNQMDDLGRHTSVSRNRFGSNLYLAISRARKLVTLLGDKGAGGIAPVVRRAEAEGLLSLK
jgi:UvrD-like helicase family protein